MKDKKPRAHDLLNKIKEVQTQRQLEPTELEKKRPRIEGDKVAEEIAEKSFLESENKETPMEIDDERPGELRG
jgi:hypothetical protein